MVFLELESMLTPDKGIIGIDAASVIKVDNFSSKNITFLDRKIDLKPIENRDWGFGISNSRSQDNSYYKIPEKHTYLVWR